MSAGTVSEIKVGRLMATPGQGPWLRGATIRIEDGRIVKSGRPSEINFDSEEFH